MEEAFPWLNDEPGQVVIILILPHRKKHVKNEIFSPGALFKPFSGTFLSPVTAKMQSFMERVEKKPGFPGFFVCRLFLALGTNMRSSSTCHHFYDHCAAFGARLALPAVYIQLKLEQANLSLGIYIGTDRAAAFFNCLRESQNNFTVEILHLSPGQRR